MFFGQVIIVRMLWGGKPSVVSVLISVWHPKKSCSQSTNFEARKNHSDLIFCFALLLGSKLEGEAASHFNAARGKHGGNHFRLTRKMVRKEEEEQTENCHVWKETKKDGRRQVMSVYLYPLCFPLRKKSSLTSPIFSFSARSFYVRVMTCFGIRILTSISKDTCLGSYGCPK